MDNHSTYLKILISTLIKKNTILEDIIKITLLQEEYLKATPQDMDSFEKSLDTKSEFIERLNQLNDGFDKLYERVREELSTNKERYPKEIVELQDQIRNVTEKSVKLQALEQQNKRKMEVYFSSQKKEIKKFKKSNQTVTSYYKNMGDRPQGESYFLDKKK